MRQLVWRLRDLVFLAGDFLSLDLLRPRRRKPPDRTAVLVIAAHGMGDLVLFLAAYAAILRHYPRPPHRITLACTEAALDFAQRCCPADAYIAIDRTRLRREAGYRWHLLRRVARDGFAVALQTSYNRDHLVEDSLIRASAAPERIGSSGTAMFIAPRDRRRGDRWYTRLLPASDRPMHELERNAELQLLLGLAPAPPALPRLPPAPRRPVVPPGRYVLFAVGSSHSMKSWPLRRFEAVARAVAARAGLAVVFSAGAGDRIGRADFAQWDDASFIDRLVMTDLDDLLALIGHAALVVSTDSAPVHLAAALGIPSLAVTGGGMTGRYHPYPGPSDDRAAPDHVGPGERWDCFDCGWRCIYPVAEGEAAPCVAQVAEQRVLEAVLARLAGDRAAQPAGAARDASTPA